MTTIRISKEFTFETSHMLKDYDGLCRNIHGHSYRLVVTVAGSPVNDHTNPKNGMVMDFGDLKKIVKDHIVDIYDHSLVVNKSVSDEKKENLRKSTERIVFTPFQPTCENMIAYFASVINSKLPNHLTLKYLRLYETANSYAEWYEDENK
jgi:6-pyruvoyltetrahydropterin/6-carboxytetrahydropterin synthase